MELLLNYLLKSGLCLLVLYLFYYTVLRKQPGFAFNRVYLLLATPLALAIPFLKWPFALATETAVGYGLRMAQLPEIKVNATIQNSPDGLFFSGYTLEHVLFGLYALVAAFLLGRLVKQLWQLSVLIRSAAIVQVSEQGIRVIKSSGGSASFAFLKYIFISDQSHLTEAEQQQVLAHETAHVQLKHSFDILYFEVLSALLWFNPIVWMLKSELRDVHEYQADALVLVNHQASQYSSLLAKEALHTSGVPIGSYFKEPQVLKRLQMLQHHNKFRRWVRPALLFPILVGLAFIFSSKQLISPVQGAATANGASQLSDAVNPILKDPVNKEMQDLEKPYAYVEQMPQFEGGDIALQKFIASNITYPANSKEAGKQGLVFIAFTVTKEGKLSDFELQKGIDEALDAEAMRIIKLTDGKWIPGKQNGKAVPVRYTIPIRFSL